MKNKYRKKETFTELLNILIRDGNSKKLTFRLGKIVAESILKYTANSESFCTSEDIYPMLMGIFSDTITKESFVVLALNSKNKVLDFEKIHIGTATHSLASPRDIFYFATKSGASRLIIAHNHPSGTVTPSKEDIILTKKLCAMGILMDIPILDHIILGAGYYSMRDEGTINFEDPTK